MIPISGSPAPQVATNAVGMPATPRTVIPMGFAPSHRRMVRRSLPTFDGDANALAGRDNLVPGILGDRDALLAATGGGVDLRLAGHKDLVEAGSRSNALDLFEHAV